MFELEFAELAGKRILDCPGGASSFAVEAAAAGARVTAVDPLYVVGADELRRRLDADVDMAFGAHGVRADIDPVWLAGQRQRWRDAGERFFADFERAVKGPGDAAEDAEGDAAGDVGGARYLAAFLPELPFRDGEFDLALVSHLIFTYDVVDPVDGLRELLRVVRPGGTVRVHPLVSSRGVRAPVEELFGDLGKEGHVARVVPVAYGRARGVGETLVIERGPVSGPGASTPSAPDAPRG